jgi:predicted transcriptional regulator
MRVRKTVLTEHELEIMQIVWQRPTVTVRDVYEELLKRRKIAYTTVMTMLGILEEKGLRPPVSKASLDALRCAVS